jgi:nicotinate-nucleotide adenylyltransferase
VLDDREIRRAGVSYTVDTLNEIRREEIVRESQRPLCLLLGMDAFGGFHGWHRWREILDVAHLIVATRPGCCMPTEGPIAALLAERRATEPRMLQTTASGLIHVRPVTSLEISSTELRELLQRGVDPRYLVPEAVRTMIVESGCYAAPHV